MVAKQLPQLTNEDKARFWEKVEKRTENECWPWMAGRIKGYGRFTVGRKCKLLSHRVAWVLSHGEIQNGLHVLHSCDTPSCCNVSHLFIGTHSSNMADMVKKGRQKGASGDANGSRIYPERMLRGESHAMAKLNASQVIEIRKLHVAGLSLKEIAVNFRVHRSLIGLITRRRIWKHVA